MARLVLSVAPPIPRTPPLLPPVGGNERSRVYPVRALSPPAGPRKTRKDVTHVTGGREIKRKIDETWSTEESARVSYAVGSTTICDDRA